MSPHELTPTRRGAQKEARTSGFLGQQFADAVFRSLCLQSITLQSTTSVTACEEPFSSLFLPFLLELMTFVNDLPTIPCSAGVAHRTAATQRYICRRNGIGEESEERVKTSRFWCFMQLIASDSHESPFSPDSMERRTARSEEQTVQ